MFVCLCVCVSFFQDDTAADRKDIALVDRTLKALARRLGYRLVMSLANSKYAGTAALIRYLHMWCPGLRRSGGGGATKYCCCLYP